MSSQRTLLDWSTGRRSNRLERKDMCPYRKEKPAHLEAAKVSWQLASVQGISYFPKRNASMGKLRRLNSKLYFSYSVPKYQTNKQKKKIKLQEPSMSYSLETDWQPTWNKIESFSLRVCFVLCIVSKLLIMKQEESPVRFKAHFLEDLYESSI